MTVMEALTDEECYLYAILSDVSGLDQAEFLTVDEQNDDGCYRAWDFQWCFAGDTEVITDQGTQLMRDLTGRSDFRLLTEKAGKSQWVHAPVRSFGPQEIWEVVVERRGVRQVIRTTENHRWFADSSRQRERRKYPTTVTADLQPGMFLKSVAPPNRLKVLRLTAAGVQHGMCWGDGTNGKSGVQVVLWGEKLSDCAVYFHGSGTPENRADVSVPGARWSLMPRYFKEPVRLDEGPSYLFSWLAGYFAADGSVSASDGSCTIDSASRDALLLTRDVCHRLGIRVGEVVSGQSTGGFGGPTTYHRLTLCSEDLTDTFFLRTSHRSKWHLSARNGYPIRDAKVVEVRSTGVVEEVFCATVPDTRSFALEGYILTHNCWYRDTSPLQIDRCARALAVDTPIPTPTGWTTMKEIQPGDWVFDETGCPVRVIEVSDVFHGRDCYEVEFDDHTSIVADRNHLWATWDKAARTARSPNRRGIPKPKVRTTHEIKETLRRGSELNHAVDVTAPLNPGNSADLLIHPYVLGFWLGDGNTGDSEFTTADPWIVEHIERLGYAVKERSSPYRYGLSYPYSHNHKTESPQAHLRRIGVLGNKHIPAEYMRSDLESRRQLLAGLFDSDGHIQSNGSAEITQKSERLSGQILELLRSLGEKPRLVRKRASCSGVDAGWVFRVSWRPRWNPALLPRKAKAWKPPGRPTQLSQRRITNVAAVESVPTKCIFVDSKNSLFLAGEGMVPTHNSVGKSMSIAVRALAFPFVHPGNEMVITAPEKVHIDAITDKIETMLLSTRLTREMLVGSGGRNSFKHQPFMANFKNGARIMGRIPQRDGKGVKGTHPLWLEQDEASDYPEQGWKELIETLKRGVEGAVWRCIAEGQLVMTRAGWKPIEAVEVGDEVWTHRNRWKPVVDTFDHGIAECVEVNGNGHHGLVMTPNHKVWLRGRRQSQGRRYMAPPRWDSIDAFQQHDKWASPVAVSGFGEPGKVPGFDRRAGEKKLEDLPDTASAEWLWLYGLYLAEGYGCEFQHGTRTHRRVHWCVHEDEADTVAARLSALGFKPQRYQQGKSVKVYVASAPLYRWLSEQAGTLAHNKALASWVFDLPDHLRAQVMAGLTFGDGWYDDKARDRWDHGTASRELAYGLKLLGQSFGYVSNVRSYEAKQDVIEGRIVNRREFYGVQMTHAEGRALQTKFDDGHAWGNLRGLTAVGRRHVYDLEVADDHSYVVEGIVVSNSHGVTRGVRDHFYKFTQPGSGWKVHSYPAMVRPTWSEEERQEKELQYGSADDPDYRRNVLGLHGDSSSFLFPLHRLMGCVDQDESSEYNLDEFYSVRISDEQLQDHNGDITTMVDVPRSHLQRKNYPVIWIGADIGYTVDPTEVAVFGETPGSGKKPGKFQLLARFHLKRIGHRDQAQMFMHLIEVYRPKVFAMDSTGVGLPLFQDIQAESLAMAKVIRGYNFSKKILVDIDSTVDVDEDMGDALKEAGIERNVKEYAQDSLRGLVDDGRLLLPWDRDVIGQFQGATATQVSGRDQYGRRRIFSGGDDHFLDAARMAALAHAVYAIEEMQKTQYEEPILDTFF